MGEEEFQVLCMLREQLLDIGAADVLDLLESGDEETAERRPDMNTNTTAEVIALVHASGITDGTGTLYTVCEEAIRAGEGTPERVREIWYEVTEAAAPVENLIEAAEWTYEGYWHAVLGIGSAADVVAAFELEPDGLDEWLGHAEAEAWAMGATGEPMPAAWAEYHGRALLALRLEAEFAAAAGGQDDA